MVNVHSPDNKGPIAELWAWVSVDETGEGIIGGQLSPGVYTPFVTGSHRMAEIMRRAAMLACEGTDKTAKLKRFVAAPD